MRVIIDRDKCIGSGNCVLAQPEIFDQGDADGIVLLLVDTPSPEQEEAVREAVSLCPSRAISVEPAGLETP
jgi:ferredoxin